MKTILRLLGVVALLASVMPSTVHAQTDVVLSLDVSTDGLTGWQTIQTVVTNMPESPQAFYRMRIATTSATPTNMALIASGSFEMGNALSASNDGDTDELPVHSVSVREFYMDKYEVSKALWDEVASLAGTHGYDINTGSASGKVSNHPVYNVTWHEAVKWSNARSQPEVQFALSDS